MARSKGFEGEDQPGLMGRLGIWSFGHIRTVSAVWLLVTLVLGALAPQAITVLSGAGWQADGSASVQVRDLARQHFHGDASSALEVVVFARDGQVTDAPVRQAIDEATGLLRRDRRISQVSVEQPGSAAGSVGRTAIVVGGAKAGAQDMVRAADDLKGPLRRLSTAAVTVRLTGSSALVSDVNAAGPGVLLKDWPVVAAIMVGTMIVFGVLIAAGLPLLLALAGLAAAAGSLALIAMLAPPSMWVLDLAMMFALALALGIGYTFFVAARFRTALARDGDPARAIAEAMDTAGRPVLMSGLTLLVSLSALALVPVPAVRAMVVSVVLAVALVLMAALTLLPAVLARFGSRFPWPVLSWARSEEPAWRWPVRFIVLGLAVPAAFFALPAGPRSSMPPISALPATADSLQGFAIIQRELGPGATAGIQIIAPAKAAPVVADSLAGLKTNGQLAVVSPPEPAADGSGLVLFRAVPWVGAFDPSLPRTVHALRAGLPGQALVGGAAVESIDLESALTDRVPLVISAGLALGLVSLLLLLSLLRFAGRSPREAGQPVAARSRPEAGGRPVVNNEWSLSEPVTAGSEPGGPRWRGMGVVLGPIAGAIVVVSVLGAGTYVFAAGGRACSGPALALEVAVAPEIQPAIADAAARLADQGRKVDGLCVSATVRATDPAQVTTLLGQGTAVGATHRPDVWIPDSSLWTALIPGPGVTPGASTAQTPIVAGVPRALADTLRSQGVASDQLSWAELLRAAGGVTAGAASGPSIRQDMVRLQVPDPSRSATGLGLLVIADGLLAKGPNQRIILTSTVRTLRDHTVADVASEFSTLHPDQQGRFPVVVVPEQALYVHNRAAAADPVLAIYPREGTLSLDYPYTITTSDAQKVKAARLLQEFVRDDTARGRLQALGFRTGSGPAAAGTWPGNSPGPQSLAVPAPADVQRILQDWYKLSLGIQNLSVIDVSASMNEQAGPDLSRLQVAVQAAQAVANTLPDDSELGVLPTSALAPGTQVTGSPIGRLGTRRQQLLTTLDKLHTGSGGGLYDSILAAFRLMTKAYQPAQVNSVLVYTAGDATGSIITQQALLAALHSEYDPAHPVQIITIGVGDGVDRGALSRIAAATQGSSYVIHTPQEVQQIVLSALSRRVCAPNC